MSSEESASSTGSGTSNESKGMVNYQDTHPSPSLGGTSCAAKSSDAKPDTKAPASHEHRMQRTERFKTEGCSKYIQSPCVGYCRRNVESLADRGEGIAHDWSCHRCGKSNSPTSRRCPSCKGWRDGKRKAEAATGAKTGRNDEFMPDVDFGDDEAFALALHQQERDQYRRREAATKIERFEPGGNPNVLDYGASTSSPSVPKDESKQKTSSSARIEEIPKAPVPMSATTKSSQNDGQIDQEAADAAIAAHLAAKYEDPRFSSAVEMAKFGRKREAVKMFQPGGDPKETNPTEDYNLPPAPPEDIESSPKRPKILSRKPGRVSKEEEARLVAAEEATQARLRDLMEGFGNLQEKADGIGGIKEEEQSQQKIQIQMSLADLLSKPCSISVDRRPTKVTISCRPAVLDLTEEEARVAEHQLRALFAFDDDIPTVGCIMSLLQGAKDNDSDEENKTPRAVGEAGEEPALETPEDCGAMFSKVLERYLIEDGESNVPLFPRAGVESGSLDVFTKSFMNHHSKFPVGSLIDIARVMKSLHMEPRRGYDVLDVLCHLNVVKRVRSAVGQNAFIWNGASGLSIYLSQLQQDAFIIHKNDAKASGYFERVGRKLQRVKNTNNDDDCPVVLPLGMVAVNLLMIVMVRQEGISISQANKRLNGSEANKRTQRRLNDAIKVLCELSILKRLEEGGMSCIEWSFRTSLAELPGLLKKWPSENYSEESRVPSLTHESSPEDPSRHSNISQSIVKDLPSMAAHMLLFDSDSDDAVICARAKVAPCEEDSFLPKMISDDLTFWEMQSSSSKGKPLDLAFLHRIMRPLVLRTRSRHHEGSVVTHQGHIKVMSFSLLDVFLQCRTLQPYFIDGIIGRLKMFLEEDAINEEGFQILLLEALRNAACASGCRQYVFSQLRRLAACFEGPARDRLVDEMISVFSASMTKEHLQEMFISAGVHPLSPTDHIGVAPSAAIFATPINLAENSPFGNHDTMEGRSCWAKDGKMQVAVRAERLRLLKAFDETARANFTPVADDFDSPRRSTRQILPRGRCKDGALIFSENEMTLREFLERRTLMRLVNESFTRSYVKGVSKPALSQLDLSYDDVKELQNVFFDEDGSLRDDMKLEIDSGMKNDPRYIVFANIECDKERKDARWQVPIRHHGVGSQINSRKKVEAIMSKRNVLITGAEELDDIGLLFGGIEDQSLHHDTARQLTSWMKHRPLADHDEMVELEAIPGWEVDRLEYNAAMASPAAPGSLLVGLHGGDSVFLGVQKDQIVRVGKNKCKIRNGKHDEILPIVRENDHLVVVEAKRGVMFTGDFPHAGVRNFSADSDEQRLMDQLKEKIAEIADRYPVHERVLRTKATVEMMANFPGLNKLCRLHCSTRMIKGGILVPDNSVGFDGCLPNAPDRRCFEDDVVSEFEEVVEVKAEPKRQKLSEPSQQGIFSAPPPNLVTPDEKSIPRCYEGERVAKYFRKKLIFGTVHEHQAGGIDAILRFDDGDFEICRLAELQNLLQLYNEHEEEDEYAIENANADEREQTKRAYQARPMDGEAILVEADVSGNIFWRKARGSKNVMVTTKVAGKPVSTSMASLPSKVVGRKNNSIVKVAKGRGGIRHDGNVVGYDSKQGQWEIQFPWGSESWKLADVEKGFAVYCSGFMDTSYLRRCVVLSCDKHSQGRKFRYMCYTHSREHGGKVAR